MGKLFYFRFLEILLELPQWNNKQSKLKCTGFIKLHAPFSSLTPVICVLSVHKYLVSCDEVEYFVNRLRNTQCFIKTPG